MRILKMDEIKRVREALKLSQNKLSKMTKLSVQTISLDEKNGESAEYKRLLISYTLNEYINDRYDVTIDEVVDNLEEAIKMFEKFEEAKKQFRKPNNKESE